MIKLAFRCLFISLVVCLIGTLAQAGEEELLYMTYPVQFSTISVIIGSDTENRGGEFVELDSAWSPDDYEQEITKYFASCGLSFPEGAYIRYNPVGQQMIHYNTLENQKMLQRLMGGGIDRPYRVQIDALFVDFPTEEIDRVARENSLPLPSSEDIMRLWKGGKGRLLHAIKLSTRSGVNAQSKAVAEHIYATEFEQPSSSETGGVASLSTRLPIPGSFETRETGAILHCTPTVGPNRRTIEISLVPELCTGPEWTNILVRAKDVNGQDLEISVPQPVFHSRTFTTSVLIDDQSTIILGGMGNPGGDGITYLFLTATLIDSLGRPLADHLGEEIE